MLPPRGLTVEMLVMELGGVCTSHYEVRPSARVEAVSDVDLTEAVDCATAAVSAALRGGADTDDEVVQAAWYAIARAQDCIRRLRETLEHSRALRERAEKLQEQSLRRRMQVPASAFRAALRRTGRD